MQPGDRPPSADALRSPVECEAAGRLNFTKPPAHMGGLPDAVLMEESTLYVSFRSSTPVSPDRIMYLCTPRRTCRNSPTKPLGVPNFRRSGSAPRSQAIVTPALLWVLQTESARPSLFRYSLRRMSFPGSICRSQFPGMLREFSFPVLLSSVAGSPEPRFRLSRVPLPQGFYGRIPDRVSRLHRSPGRVGDKPSHVNFPHSPAACS